jgi:hypothetical protein
LRDYNPNWLSRESPAKSFEDQKSCDEKNLFVAHWNPTPSFDVEASYL